MRYPREVIEEVRMQNDIVEIISGYVPLKQKGSSYFGLCPFHNEKSPSFSVNSEKQFYYCFGCGAAGNVFGFLMEMENYDFPEALRVLAERANYQLPTEEKSGQALAMEQLRSRLLEMHTVAGRFYYETLQSDAGAEALSYIENRQLSLPVSRKFGLGYAPNAYNSLYNHFKEKGYSIGDMLQSGLVIENKDKNGYHDRFRDRLMFPIFDPQGRVVGFGGRIIGRGEPKYLNSPETILFSKSRNLYGLNFAKAAKKKELILVEGYMDMISLYQAGFKNVVAALGTAFNKDHARTLKKFAEDIILLYDSDEAGTTAALRAIPVLVENGFRVRVLQVPDGKDPDEFIKQNGASAFAKLLLDAVHYISFEIACIQRKYNLQSPEHKVRFANEAADILSKLDNAIERNVYAKEVSKMTGVEEEAIRSEIQKRVQKEELSFQKEAQRQQNQWKAASVSTKVEKGILEAQRSILYLCASDEKIYQKIAETMEPQDFTDPVQYRILQVMGELWKDAGHVFPAEMVNFFEQNADQRQVAEIFALEMLLGEREDVEKGLNESVKQLKQRKIDLQMNTATTVEEIQKLMELKRKLDSLYITI
ncbi:DNA primase [Chakrabartyella piscis]|uniref:DNA primase n=1 Tax=Chakrabartyella piscis TaxID=2918914 RepID=UPI002958B4F2|nr:DNA primase [Chakrabartyella piscis]